MPPDPTRRSLLETGAAAISIGGLASHAGCLGYFTGNRGSPTAGSFITRWWTAPGRVVPSVQSSGPDVAYFFSPAAILAARERVDDDLLPGVITGENTDQWGVLDLDLADVQYYFAYSMIGRYSVLRYDHDVESASETLESKGFEQLGHHRGFDCFGRPRQDGDDRDETRTPGRLRAINGSTVVMTSRFRWPEDSGVAVLKAIVDGGVGAVEGVPETDDGAAAVLDDLGDAAFAIVDPRGTYEGRSVDHSDAFEFGTDALQFREQFLFRDASAVATDHLQQDVDELETPGKGRYDASEIHLHVRGPLAELVYDVPYDTLLN